MKKTIQPKSFKDWCDGKYDFSDFGYGPTRVTHALGDYVTEMVEDMKNRVENPDMVLHERSIDPGKSTPTPYSVELRKFIMHNNLSTGDILHWPNWKLGYIDMECVSSRGFLLTYAGPFGRPKRLFSGVEIRPYDE